MSIEIKVRGLDEVRKKLDGKFLIQPEVETRIRDKLIERIERRRKTAGFVNNPLQSRRLALRQDGGPIAIIGSPLNPPRTTGRSWLRFVYSLVRGSFMQRQLNTAIKEINARWSA